MLFFFSLIVPTSRFFSSILFCQVSSLLCITNFHSYDLFSQIEMTFDSHYVELLAGSFE